MILVEENDHILTSPCTNFDFANPPFDPIEYAKQLIEFLYEKNGIGVSANQVGVPYRIIAMRGYPQNFVCYNPKIVMPSTETVVLEETSLTHSGLFVKVKRPQHIRARFTVPNGQTQTEVFTGMSARTFQQQLDFLDGIEYYNRANKYHKELAFKKRKK